jgi:hypothetical protein
LKIRAPRLSAKRTHECHGNPLEVCFQRPWRGISVCPGWLSASPGAESAQEKDDQAYQQHQAKPAAADDGATEVKPAAAEQEKQNYD